jgi:hypothetical protein
VRVVDEPARQRYVRDRLPSRRKELRRARHPKVSHEFSHRHPMDPPEPPTQEHRVYTRRRRRVGRTNPPVGMRPEVLLCPREPGGRGSAMCPRVGTCRDAEQCQRQPVDHRR